MDCQNFENSLRRILPCLESVEVENNNNNNPGSTKYEKAHSKRRDMNMAKLEKQRLEEPTIFQCARNGMYRQASSILQKNNEVKTINKKAFIDETDGDGSTALHYAARYNQYEVVTLLVENGADVNCITVPEKMTPLMFACRMKRTRSTEERFGGTTIATKYQQSIRFGGRTVKKCCTSIAYLLSREAKWDARDQCNLTALHHAALRGDELACEKLLEYATAHNIRQFMVDAKDVQLMTPLHTAVCQAHPDIVKQLLDAGSDVFSTDGELSTPFHKAAWTGDVTIGKLLTDPMLRDKNQLNALISAKDVHDNTALMLAVDSVKYDFCMFLFELGATHDVTNNILMTPMHLAVGKADMSIVELLADRGASITSVNYDQQTPLHIACACGQISCINFLLDKGSDIEARDRNDSTPLLLAAANGHAQAVELLLQKAADPEAEDKYDRTVVFIAAEQNQTSVMQVLMEYEETSALKNNRNENNNTPLHMAASLGHVGIVKCLLENEAKLSSKNDMEKTAMHLAAEHGFDKVVWEIAARDKNALIASDEESKTALHLAAEGGHIKVLEILLKLGARTDTKNSSLQTPLGSAAASGHLRVVKRLIGADAMIDCSDKLMLTPLLVAAQNGHLEVVDYLLQKKASVDKCDLEGRNCLDIAIDNDHTEVVQVILNSQSWETALKNSNEVEGKECTPIRRLITKMPELALKVFDKCIKMVIEDTSDGSQSYKAEYNFEYIDDLYAISEWKASSKENKKAADKNAKEEEERCCNYCNLELRPKLDSFEREDITYVPYTPDPIVFKDNHPMELMVGAKRLELLKHPLVTALRHQKWERYGSYIFWVNFAFYSVFLVSLSVYVLVVKPPYVLEEEAILNQTTVGARSGVTNSQPFENQAMGGTETAVENTLPTVSVDEQTPEPVGAKSLKIITCILVFINLLREFGQLIYMKLSYFNYGNIVESIVYISSFIFVIDFMVPKEALFYHNDLRWYFGMIAVVLGWTALVNFTQKFPGIGIYVFMFNTVFKTFMICGAVFMLFIIGFGLGYHLLLQNHVPYATPYHSIIRTMVMIAGEFDYTDTFHGEEENKFWITYILFLVVLMVVAIVIMNLMSGLAVDDIKGVREAASLTRKAMETHMIMDIERLYQCIVTRRYNGCTYTQIFKTKEEMVKSTTSKFEDTVQESQKITMKKMGDIQKTVVGLYSKSTKIITNGTETEMTVHQLQKAMKNLEAKTDSIQEMLGALLRSQNIRMPRPPVTDVIPRPRRSVTDVQNTSTDI